MYHPPPSSINFPLRKKLKKKFSCVRCYLINTAVKSIFEVLKAVEERDNKMDTNVYESCADLITEFHTHKVSPDEILALKVNHLVPIPFKTREDLDQDTQDDRNDGLFHGSVVPRIDLKVLHYFATQLCLLKYPHLINTMDETSMITLGLLVEQWIEEYLTSLNNDQDDNETEYTDSNSVSESESQSDSESEQVTDGETSNPHSPAMTSRSRDTTPETQRETLCIGKGPSEVVSKMTKYRDSPTDI